MKNFDIILGMNWLSKNREIINYRDGEVIFQQPGKEPFLFQRGKMRSTPLIISAMKAVKMMRKDSFQAYWANKFSKATQGLLMEDIHVVREYPDIFPEEIDGASPNRQVVFSIDIVPRAAPVSKAPYRMALMELQE